MKKSLIVLMTCVLGLMSTARAQVVEHGVLSGDLEAADSVLYEISLIDGSTLVGSVKFADSSTVLLSNSTFPELLIPLSKITTMQRLAANRLVNGQLFYPNPNPTRYLLGPNAFTFKQGEGYLQSHYAVFNGVHFGITDHFMMGGGLELVSTLSGYPTIFIAPKVGFEVAESVNIAVGAIGTYVYDWGAYGIGYVVGTFGDQEKNLSVSAAYGSLLDLYDYSPMLGVSGFARVSKRLGIVSENWLIMADGETDGIMSFGVRVIGKKFSVDFALINNPTISDEFLIGLPFVTFAIPL